MSYNPAHRTRSTLRLPDATNSFGFDIMTSAYDFQTKNDTCIPGDGARSSRSDCPLLKSLLIWGHSSGDKTATAKQTAAGQPELATRRPVFNQRQGRADSSLQTLLPNGADHGAVAQPSPSAACNMRRRLNASDLTQIRKIERIFRRAMRLPFCCRQQMPSSSLLNAACVDGLQHLVVHARSSALRLLRFACQLPQLHRKPPHVQVALLKAASTGCIVLHLAQSYNCERGCWLDSHGAEFRPQDLARVVPSPTRPELWDDIAAVSAFLKSLMRPDSESVDGDGDDPMLRFFSLLNAVLIMSPENVPCARECDRDIAAAVSDSQQSFILLLRRHLESSLSVVRTAKLLPMLLMHLVTIKRLAMNVRIALLSQRMVRRDSMLADALSLELAMF